MSLDNLCTRLIEIADNELASIQKQVPADPIQRFALFVEMVRFIDLRYFVYGSNYDNNPTEAPTHDIIWMGWNLAISNLFSRIPVPGFPIMESTSNTRKQIGNLLYRLGSISLLRRTVDMLKTGLLTATETETSYVFESTGIMEGQFADTLEFQDLLNLESQINSIEENYYAGWNLVDKNELQDVLYKEGNYLLKQDELEVSEKSIVDIDKLMISMIKPWDSGKGLMISYDSSPELDSHFLLKALKLVNTWRDEAGIHPEIEFPTFKGYELTAIVVFIVSFHLKHLHFSDLASDNFKEISIPQSLTLWCPKKDMENAIADYTGLSCDLISEIFKAITLDESDTVFLKNHTSKFMPLLIDAGNGFVIRPLSSILINPFITIISLMEYRNSNIRHNVSKPREEWIRKKIYALFSGLRYERIDGNINLKSSGSTVTDIDGAIYDNVSGELALFQFKW